MRVDRRELHNALSELARLAPKNHTLPALERVLLSASNGTLTLTTTDLSRRLSCQLPAEGDINVSVHCKLLVQVIKFEGRGAAGTVEFYQDDEKVSVLADGLTTHLRTMLPGEFPAEHSPTKMEPWSLLGMWPSAPLGDALTFVLLAASKDESRPHLCTVLLQDQDAVTTDGHRLHLAPLPVALTQPLLLPAEGAGTLNRILNKGEQVILAQAGEVLRAKVGPYQLDIRLSDKKFPPYNQVIPNQDNQPTHIQVQAKLLSKALTRVSRLTCDKRLKLRINGSITMTTWESEEGAAEIEVPVSRSNHEGEDLHIGFDAPYLQQAVAKGVEEVELGFAGELDPMRVDQAGGRVAVIMPLRLG